MSAEYGMLTFARRGPRQRVNVAKTAIYLLLPLLVTAMAAGEIRGQTGPREATLRRSVPRDAETMVSSAARWRFRGDLGLCVVYSVPPIELVTPPKHGTVRFVITVIGAPSGSGCSNSVSGWAVLYQPAPGFVGEDQFTYNIAADSRAMEWFLPQGLKTVIVTVRDQNTLGR